MKSLIEAASLPSPTSPHPTTIPSSFLPLSLPLQTLLSSRDGEFGIEVGGFLPCSKQWGHPGSQRSFLASAFPCTDSVILKLSRKKVEARLESWCCH